MTEVTIEALNDKINRLTATVEKQSALISKTGQQVIEMQVKSVKSKMNAVDNKPVDMTDYVLNEDIVQLVGELQTQLDYLEDRTIARVFNAKLTDSEASKPIAPICNKDGELPPPDLYPATVGAFFKLDKFQVLQLCEFYELIMPNEQDLSSFLQDENSQSLQEANRKLTKDLQHRVDQLSASELDDLKDELSRFLGLSFRINTQSW